MKHCKFLIGWMNGSDGANGDETGINSPNDLETLYNEGSEYVACYEFDAPDNLSYKELTYMGMGYAFMQDWTAHDTFTDILIS